MLMEFNNALAPVLVLEPSWKLVGDDVAIKLAEVPICTSICR